MFSRIRKKESLDLIGPPPPRRWFLLVRIVLFLIIIAVLMAFLALSFWPDKNSAGWISTLGQTIGLSLPDLVNLQINGQDGQGRPYIITAHSAQPKKDSILKSIMVESGSLAGVEVNLDMGNEESWISLRSRAGEFDTSRHHLRVGPGFELYTSTGYQMHGRSASFDLKKGLVIVHGEVDGWGPIGEITAASLKSSDMGNQIHFYGGVVALIRPSKNKE